MYAALAHYFKGHDTVGVTYKERMPTGIHGTQIPDAMVALTATAVSVYPSDYILPVLTHQRLAERFKLPLKNLLREGVQLSRRRPIVRSTGAISTQSKL
jgi:hypothetical protein